MICEMIETDDIDRSAGNELCKSCGLCCTGHLFIWTKLRSVELDTAAALGVPVFGSDPSQRGFSQPCPLWQGQCTIYSSPHYPHFCRTYKCSLLNKVMDETTSLQDALGAIEAAKEVIRDLEALLPGSRHTNFRERLVEHLDELEKKPTWDNGDLVFRRKADALIGLYERIFGVKDLGNDPWTALT
jgi:hypothetical protein